MKSPRLSNRRCGPDRPWLTNAAAGKRPRYKLPEGHRRYLAVLAGLFAVLWIGLAIDPHDRADWALENVLVGLFVPALAYSYRYFVFSRVSYTCIFLFLCLHIVGAHYTYAEVPYDDWAQTLLGFSIDQSLGWERNHFDRAVHFLYGLLLAYPIREIALRVANMRGFWAYMIPLDLTMSTSMLFELFEWFAAALFGGDLGVAYLGTQGDEWDAQKDMALATLGAMIAMAVTAAINIPLQKDFAQEWIDSLRVKDPVPLGENEIARMMKDSERV